MTTKKQEQIKSLTWKYFWEQKLKEIGRGIGIAFLFTIVPYFIGILVGVEFLGECTYEFYFACVIIANWMVGLIFLIIGGGIFTLIFVVLRDWIKSNWKKAKKRAIEKINEK